MKSSILGNKPLRRLSENLNHKAISTLVYGIYSIKIAKWFKYFFNFFIYPKSTNKDFARNEFIVNVLLLGSIFLASIATISALVGEIKRTSPTGSSLKVFIIILIFLMGYIASRKGKYKLVSYVMLIFYLMITTYSAYLYGADVPQDILTFALIVVMSGIVIGSRFAFMMTITISFILVSLIYLQGSAFIRISSSWKNSTTTLGDALVYSITLFIIALVSWLSNREIEKSLIRARNSEAELKKERDHLEIEVAKRTKELQQTQMEKITQLYRFAEFGRLASGLFHDLVNPLSIVSLNLESMKYESKEHRKQEVTNIRKYLRRATLGTNRLETFVLTARKQLQNTQEKQFFSPAKEMQQVIKLHTYRMREEKIHIEFLFEKQIKVYGNVIKFSQIVTNLISNAIEAFASVEKKSERKISIELQKKKSQITLTVKNNGEEIPKENYIKIFNPAFTTKKSNTNMGLGLFITKDIIEKDFHGKIYVSCKKPDWTVFSIFLPLHDKGKQKDS